MSTQKRQSVYGWIMRILIILSFTLLFAASAKAETLTGSVEAIDGDTLKVGGKVVRLAGIDAPDIDQTCQFNGQDVNCGEIARDALLDLITATDVICEIRSDDTATPPPATCTSDGFDVSGNMVYTGWALPEPGDPAYDAVMADARDNERGLWRMTFDEPWIWRASAP